MYVSKEHIYGLLRECIHKKDLKGGRRVQCIIITNGFFQINILSNNLIRLFASCGCLLEANLVFCSIPQPSVLSWEAIISAYASSGRHDVALTLYHTMNVEGIEVNRCIFLSILKGSTSDGYGVKRGMTIHNEIMRNGFDSDKAVMNSLIDMYAKSGNLDEAQKVFDKTVNRDIVSFSAMITGYTLHGYGSLALSLFEKLHEQDEKLDKVTFLTALKACSNEASVRQGRLIHDELIESGFESDMLIGSAVIDMYAKCGSLEEAQRTFDILQNRNIISWGALISGYAQHGYGNAVLQLYNEMAMSNIVPDKVIFVCALKACGSMQSIVHGRYIHNQIIRMGHISDPIVSSALIDMYGNCGSLNEAQKVFDTLPVQDVAIWNALICSYTRHNQGHSALKRFQEMQKGTIKPNNAILASVLKACSTIGDTVQGLILHDQVIRSGMDSDAIVGSSAVDMYSNHGAIQEAQKVFDISPKKDVVLWGSLIAGYGQNGYGLSALLVFEKMQKKHVKPSSFIFSSVLKSCTTIGALEEGQLIYDQILKNGLESDVIIGNALVNLYSSCESLEEARNIFDRAVHLDMVSWNAMISGYVRQRHAISALELFDQMQQSHWVNPDKVTFSCVLKICGNVGVLGTGKHIHSEVLKNQLESDVVVGTSLIDMYATCGALEEARQVFDTLENRNWFSWCALIAGYAQHEKWDLAVQCIHEMQCQGFKPDDRIHTIMLASCSQLGELHEGYRYFKSLKEVYGSLPNEEHFNCMIDLFARSGNLSEALEILKTIPTSPDIIGWTSLLTASEKFSHTGMGGDCFNEIVRINPTFPVAYMFMANIYSDSNMSRNNLVTCNQ